MATIVAKNLSCLVTMLASFLSSAFTHLALLNSLRSFLVSSDSNVFTSPSHFLCVNFYFATLDKRDLAVSMRLIASISCLATFYSSGKLATIVAKTFLDFDNRLLLSSSSALAYSFSSTKLVTLFSCFVRFKFHFAKPFFFVLTLLCYFR